MVTTVARLDGQLIPHPQCHVGAGNFGTSSAPPRQALPTIHVTTSESESKKNPRSFKNTAGILICICIYVYVWTYCNNLHHTVLCGNNSVVENRHRILQENPNERPLITHISESIISQSINIQSIINLPSTTLTPGEFA